MTETQKLNSSIWATLRPSPIHGIGVFAIRDIPEGILITDYSVHDLTIRPYLYTIAARDFDLIHPEIRRLILDRMTFSEGSKFLTFPSPNGEATLRSFMNHSKDPNTDGRRTIRRVQKGEELTEDYQSFGYEMHELTKNHYDFL